MEEPEHVSRLWENTDYFREQLNSMGFDTGNSETPIIPVMCGESRIAQELSKSLKQQGVLVGAIVFPMVSRDKARVRTQMSSGLSREDLDVVLSAFELSGRKLGLL
jgi:glycine C-acetyltransferase